MKFKTILFTLLFLAALLLPGFASAMAATISIPAQYSTVKAGTPVYFETDIKWPENTTRQDLKIEYSVKDSAGTEIAYSKVLKAIETQASFMDSIAIPEVTKPGLYKLYATISDYKDLNQDVAASFNVTSAGSNIMTYLFIIAGILGAFMIFIVIEVFVLMRRKKV
ncbi:MAG: hypothetical protein PHU42_01805 [Patescibacteria group bacterium]|nr:hypothetical protein [Patescibacteria group bacterium]